jgi:hypothetical protein
MSTDVDFGIGPSVLRPWISDSPPGGWKSVFAEWIDNSFDADAYKIVITLDGRCLTAEDNGCGCDNLRVMQAPGRSARHPTNKAGLYGVGGVRSQAFASGGTPTEVYSVHKNKTSRMVMNWKKCIETGIFEYELFTESAGSEVTGTRIKIPSSRWSPKPSELEKLFREMSYLFAARLQEGRKIIFDINGNKAVLKPYRHPAFVKQVDISFDLDGHHITGFCGLVKPGQQNPYNGWSIFFGHRVLMKTQEPGGGKETKHVYGEIRLGDSWKDVNSSKDNFIHDQSELWEKIGSTCAEIVDASDQQSQDFELSTSTQEAESILCGAIKLLKKRKGRRPEIAGKEGTVEPTGNGKPHEHFTHDQPGDKEAEVSDYEPGTSRIPDRIRITWGDLEDAYEMETTTHGKRGKQILIRLNENVPALKAIRHNPVALALEAGTLISHEYEIDQNRGVQLVLNFKRGITFKECLIKILSRMAVPELETV